MSCNASKSVPRASRGWAGEPPPSTVMVPWQNPYHLQVSSHFIHLLLWRFSFIIVSPSFNSGPSSKPTNSQTALFNEKSPVHGPVHSPVHSPQSRFCSVPYHSMQPYVDLYIKATYPVLSHREVTQATLYCTPAKGWLL